nr:unnamed protein product [Spirometra erinaceieuropaei]
MPLSTRQLSRTRSLRLPSTYGSAQEPTPVVAQRLATNNWKVLPPRIKGSGVTASGLLAVILCLSSPLVIIWNFQLLATVRAPVLARVMNIQGTMEVLIPAPQ